MSRALRIALGASAAAAALLWTLGVLGCWWLLQAGAALLEGHSPAAVLQAFTAWSERPWVRYWLDPYAAEALRDGLDWLLSLGQGAAAWTGPVLAWLGVVLLVVWAGGLLLGALSGLAVVLLVSSLRRRFGARPGWHASPPPAPEAGPV